MANAGAHLAQLRWGHLEGRRRGGRAATYRVLQAVHRNGKRGGMHDVQTVHRVVLKQRGPIPPTPPQRAAAESFPLR